MAKKVFTDESLSAFVDEVKSYTDSAVSTKANSSHTHNYAGSSSAGGAATSANKVNKTLVVQLNSGAIEGTNKFTFDGSAEKAVNITPSAIGASASAHNHDDRYYTETEVDTKLAGKADSSHGNHVPTVQTANNAIFLRNDNTWQKVTPANIGAAASSHNHSATDITSGTLSVTRGGTGAATVAAARTNLGVYSTTEVDTKVSNAVSGLASTSSVNSAISTHNSSNTAHSDIRETLDAIKEDVDTFFKDATISDTAKDTLKEIQDYITSDAAAAAEMTSSIANKAAKDHTHTVSHTPAGTVSQPTFSGTAVTSDVPSGSTTVASSTHTHKYTPAGIVSQPTFTGSAVTSGANSGNAVSVYSITAVGTLPTLTASVTNKCLTFTFSQGTLPTKGSAQSVAPSGHTHSVTAAGTVSQPSFTGTEASTTSISGTTSVASNAHTHSVTAAGTVSKPTFTGTAASLTTSTEK